MQAPSAHVAIAWMTAALLSAGVATGCSRAAEKEAPPTSPPESAACVATPGAGLLDVDPADTPETPFARPAPGEELTVTVANTNLEPGLWRQVEVAARTWSASPCVEVVAKDRCPSQEPCVRVRAHARDVLERLEPDGGWADSDGTFTGRDRDGVRLGGRISLNLTLFATTSSNGRLATITHELGHALGLPHRLEPDDLMHAETDDSTDPAPDAIDLHNLRVLYGTRA